jgi:hypothetical protein
LARLERFDEAAPTTFVLVGALLTYGPLTLEDTYLPGRRLIRRASRPAMLA